MAANHATSPQRTHCKNGHAFTPENTYVNALSGVPKYQCRACRRSRRKTGPATSGSVELDAKARRRLLAAFEDGVSKDDLAERFGLHHATLQVQIALARKEAE